MTDVLTVLGHPDSNSYCGALARAYHRGAKHAGRSATLIQVGDLRFDPILHHGYRQRQELEPDLVRFREYITAARHVAWVFPVWWGAPPTLLKGLIDRAFLPGWAFAAQDHGLPKRLLSGRSARTLITMDAPHWFYRLMYRGSAHRAFAKATLWFTGFAPIRSTTLYGMDKASEAKRQSWLDKAAALGERDAARLPPSMSGEPTLSGEPIAGVLTASDAR